MEVRKAVEERGKLKVEEVSQALNYQASASDVLRPPGQRSPCCEVH